MNYENPLLQYAEALEPPAAFRCDMWPCKNKIALGEQYVEKDERRMCMGCARLYGRDGKIKIAEEVEI